MKIKGKELIIVLLVALCLSGCGKKQDSNIEEVNTIESKQETLQKNAVKEEKIEYPQIAYVNNISYYGTGEICDMVPRKAPDGTIETFVPEEIMPDAPNSANFGRQQKKLEYIILEDKRLIVHIGENWYYFEEKKTDE